MALVVEIKFDTNTKTFLCDATEFNLKKGDFVIADYSDCHDFAEVVSNSKNVELAEELTKVFKKVDENDKQAYKQVLEKSKTSFKKVQDAILKFNLNMKLVDVKHSFDMSKLFVNYSAENRVDFRELVKFLASIFKTRVELRQISTREEAKVLTGCGVCGRPFCCATFLAQSPQVTIKMAKAQGLALNPNKINGVCGKLLCCVAFEHPEYQQALEKLPPLGSVVKTPEGEGEVVFQDLIKERVSVKIFEDEQNYKICDFGLDDLKES